MYFVYRNGWVFPNDDLANQENVAMLKASGLKIIVILKQGFGTDLILPYHQVEDDQYLRIYQLQ